MSFDSTNKGSNPLSICNGNSNYNSNITWIDKAAEKWHKMDSLLAKLQKRLKGLEMSKQTNTSQETKSRRGKPEGTSFTVAELFALAKAIHEHAGRVEKVTQSLENSVGKGRIGLKLNYMRPILAGLQAIRSFTREAEDKIDRGLFLHFEETGEVEFSLGSKDQMARAGLEKQAFKQLLREHGGEAVAAAMIEEKNRGGSTTPERKKLPAKKSKK